MGMHDLHSGPEDALFFDDCVECTERARNPLDALLQLDAERFQILRSRMMGVEFGEGEDRALKGYRTFNEQKVGRALYYVALLEERHGKVR